MFGMMNAPLLLAFLIPNIALSGTVDLPWLDGVLSVGEEYTRSLSTTTGDACNLSDLEECLVGNEGYGGCSILARSVGNWCDASHLGFGSVCCGPVESCCQLSSHGVAILILSFLLFTATISLACCAVHPCCPLYSVLCLAQQPQRQERQVSSPRCRYDVENDTYPIGPRHSSRRERDFWKEPIKS